MKRGTVKFFNAKKGWGFITDSDGKDVFVHHSQIQMEGFRYLSEGDIVNYEVGTPGTNDRPQAVNVKPILTRKMVEDALEKDGLLQLCRTANTVENAYHPWMVVDSNGIVQTSEHGMTLEEVAMFAGIDISELE